LRDLVALEVVTPKDSANGKRYAVRGRDGAIVDAFGFDLTPLQARRGDWAQAIQARAEARERRRRAFDLLTIHRRAVGEALTALASRYPGSPTSPRSRRASRRAPRSVAARVIRTSSSMPGASCARWWKRASTQPAVTARLART
jgi:hypothetical protein